MRRREERVTRGRGKKGVWRAKGRGGGGTRSKKKSGGGSGVGRERERERARDRQTDAGAGGRKVVCVCGGGGVASLAGEARVVGLGDVNARLQVLVRDRELVCAMILVYT